MALHAALKQLVIDTLDNTNQGLIDADEHRELLRGTGNLIDQLGAAEIKGVAQPLTSPVAGETVEAYFTSENGTYTGFNNLVVTDELALLQWNGVAWSKLSLLDTTGFGALELVKENVSSPSTSTPAGPNTLHLGEADALKIFAAGDASLTGNFDVNLRLFINGAFSTNSDGDLSVGDTTNVARKISFASISSGVDRALVGYDGFEAIFGGGAGKGASILANNTIAYSIDPSLNHDFKNGTALFGGAATFNDLVTLDDINPVFRLFDSSGAVDEKYFYLQNTGPRLDFNIANDAFDSFTTLMTLLRTGGLGIGTNAPDELLHLKASTTNKPVILLENDNAAGANPHVRFIDTNENYGYAIGIDDTNNKFVISSGATTVTTAGNHVFVIENNNIGIGTSAPGNKFHVSSIDALAANFERTDTSTVSLGLKTTAGQRFIGLAADNTLRFGGDANPTNNASLFLDSGGTFTGNVIINAGFGAGTGLGFGDGDSEFYESADDTLFLRLGGTNRFVFTSSAMGSANGTGAGISISASSETVPGLVPSRSSLGSGMGSAGADIPVLIANNVPALWVTETSGRPRVAIGEASSMPNSSVELGGSIATDTISPSGSVTLDISNHTVFQQTTGNHTLPTAIGNLGREYQLMEVSGTGTSVITPFGGETLNGVGAPLGMVPFKWYKLKSDGANWLFSVSA